MTSLSIRLRLAAWFSGAMLLGLSLFGLGMWYALEQRLLASVDAHLAQRAAGLRRALGDSDIRSRADLQHELGEFANAFPAGGLVQLRDRSGDLILASPNQLTFPNHSGKPYRTLTVRLDSRGQPFEALLAQSLDDTLAAMRDFRNLLFLMIPAALLVACLGGYWLSLRALRPVDAITGVAKLISVRNLSQRVAVPRTGDELQRMSETWNEVLDRLETSVKRIRQFTADASHELRTPLSLIRATAELALRREREPQEYRRSLLAIQRVAEQMTELTEDLLTVARADSTAFDMPLSDIDLTDLVNDVVEQSRPIAAGKEICLTPETDGGPVVAKANADGIRRLLRILIDNALRHTPEAGTVVVSARRTPDGAELAVQDTGEGIPHTQQPYIFERFYRGDPARVSGSGFGLGLSIAQAIAQAHGSQVVVKSEPGAGARFSLILRT